jgi:hypothetical protein
MIIHFFSTHNVATSIIKNIFSQKKSNLFVEEIVTQLLQAVLCLEPNELGINPSLYNVNLNILCLNLIHT